MTVLTSNIRKGGALLEDSRLLVEVWDPKLSPEDNLTRVVDGNLLAKSSNRRLEDVLLRILRPRFVDGDPAVIAALRLLIPNPQAFREACYFEASRDDLLLARFAEEPLFAWYEQGRLGLDTEDVRGWLNDLEAAGEIGQWSDSSKTKVARGLLAALRDFGILEGAVRKDFARPNLSVAGFGYVSFRLHSLGASSQALIASNVWRRWLLDRGRLDELLFEADRRGLFTFSRAGSTVRFDWKVTTLEEACSVVA